MLVFQCFVHMGTYVRVGMVNETYPSIPLLHIIHDSIPVLSSPSSAQRFVAFLPSDRSHPFSLATPHFSIPDVGVLPVPPLRSPDSAIEIK